MAAQAGSSGKPQKPKSRIPTAASSWDEQTLNLLNAKFLMNAETHEGKITEFPPERPFGIDVQFKLPENAQKSPYPSLTMLIVVIDETAAAFLRVNNGRTLTTNYMFDELSHPQLTHFLTFYDKLEESLLRKQGSHQIGDPTKQRPSSGDATLEKVADNIANDFLRATFNVIRLRKNHFWWATQHKSSMVLRHQRYSIFRVL
jgi:hypothetical protein